MSTLDEITKEKQRLGEALARVDAQRDKLVSELNELEATERVLARYTEGRPGRRTSSAKMPSTEGQAAAPPRRRGRQRAATGKPASKRGSPTLGDQGPCPGNRQNAAGNRRCMQRRSPKPRRRRPCPTQTGWPHRRARRETLRHTVGRDGAARRALTRTKSVGRAGSEIGDKPEDPDCEASSESYDPDLC